MHLLVLFCLKPIRFISVPKIMLISVSYLHFRNNQEVLIVLQNGKTFSDIRNKFYSSEYSFYE